MATIIGRKQEQSELKRSFESPTSEFVSLYGRRRVGKTFLVRQYFENKFAFTLTGLANANMKSQLQNFQFSMRDAGDTNAIVPANWLEAFQQLKAYLEKLTDTKKVIFLDELPWIDTPKSNFLSALEHFWNSWAAHRTDILLIVCGSSTSWMIDKLINNKGGLYNRITVRMRIQPFTLLECKLYLQELGIVWENYSIAECYMIMGGIPYYWSLLKKGTSLAQNIDRLFFATSGTLNDEFTNLYAALFNSSDKYIELVKVISAKNKGITRSELLQSLNEKSGGGVSKMLDDLENSGFIRSYMPFDKKSKDKIFQLVDFYSLFYFKFANIIKTGSDNFWSGAIDSPIHRTWSGYAFEQLCLAHLPQLKFSLGISGVRTNAFSWLSKNVDNRTQIDLLIDRNDAVINLCEMKFSINEFSIDKKYAETLRNRIGIFRAETKTKKSVFLTMITTYGVAKNEYSELIQNELKLDDMFVI